MNILYIILFSILYVIVIVGLKYLAMTIINSEDTIKCPKCGSTMKYLDCDSKYGELNIGDTFHFRPLVPYNILYICPKCGCIKTILIDTNDKIKK